MYFFEPGLVHPHPLELNEWARERGRTAHQTTDASLMLEAAELLREQGPTAILRRQALTEAVLPDGTSRADLLDTLCYQLNRCGPTQSLLIVDPYLFPKAADASYLTDLISLIEPALKAGAKLRIATKQDHDQALNAAFMNSVSALQNGAPPELKLTDVFHDRFWIADGERGMFVGTSLNGIGRRYAMTDYLAVDDAREVTARYDALP